MKRAWITIAAALLTVPACSATSGNSADDKTVTLVTHDSFAASKDVLREFEKESGYTVRVLKGGDAGSVVNQAILTKGRPRGDVLFGVDNTFLSRATTAKLFTPYQVKDAGQQKIAPTDGVTPIDYGDVCVNYDKSYFTNGKEPPQSFADLTKPAYKNLLTVENPATSSPGLAFLLGTIANTADWQAYWKQLKANGVQVVDSWEEAYNQRFSGGAESKGNRPLVVSYASSPPVEVIYADPKPTTAPTGVSAGTCYRQVEYAGLLAGAKNPDGGKKLLDFLAGKRFQEDLPLQMFVWPVRTDAALPAEFTKFAATPATPKALDADDIAGNRESWIKTWTNAVVR